MKVEITPFTSNADGTKKYGTPFQVTGDVAEEQVDAFKLNGKPLLEVVAAIRAASVNPIDRGNEQNNLSFQISRSHASAGHAAFFVFTHLNELPRSGRVGLTFYDDDNAVIGRVFLNASAIAGWEADFIGSSTTYGYSIVAGAVELDAKAA